MPLNTQEFIPLDHSRVMMPPAAMEAPGLHHYTANQAAAAASCSQTIIPLPYYNSASYLNLHSSYGMEPFSDSGSYEYFNTQYQQQQQQQQQQQASQQPPMSLVTTQMPSKDLSAYGDTYDVKLQRETATIPRTKPLRFVSSPYDLDAPKRKYHFEDHQSDISPSVYLSADPNANLAQFSKEDIIILKNILPDAEIHKWKYISNRLSKSKSKKLNTEYCISKFHQMYNLPFNPRNSPLDSNYSLKSNIEFNDNNGVNYEGMIGSSLGYILSRDGWNLID